MDLAIDQTSSGTGQSLASRFVELGLKPIVNPVDQQSLLAARRCGRIVTEGGRLEAIYGRWLPHTGNLLQVWWDSKFRHFPRDRCELYYHAVLSCPGFLTLSYIRSGARTSLSTFFAATLMLDEIARLSHANAIVCNVTNRRISDRLMLRWGWEKHCRQWSGRHYIKRFYGRYPEIPGSWRTKLRLEESI